MIARRPVRIRITDDLGRLRAHVQRCAERAGLAPERVDDLLIAANEAVVNVLEHGGGRGTLTCWHDGAYVTVDVTDEQGRLTAEHARRGRPATPGARGYGLWLMGVLCDEVAIQRLAGRSRVRLRMRLRPA
ncbi:anti-sigma regulatory factor (Ser/Thr protein kinase) [Thermocatellispora tengchongensis]|uniref:Anti-sigma regulatory factor (Ser/Thr protein kinase) n=1 Tax=Thermocatellispora tengchongensis TaxID=1073253 RepID=A0A840PC99_9ACTN|nr:ATP-binding protein [Thermocatellispora tengchongensis]MBB5139044.1 anti-sigma regulatory factor (Ser/Thr protein kinase) [Thermocatellispora tengchongensis]